MAMTIAELAQVPSENHADYMLMRLGPLVPNKGEVMKKVRECSALKRRKEYRHFVKIKSALSSMNDICEVDVPEVGPAYNELAKLFRTIGEMEIS